MIGVTWSSIIEKLDSKCEVSRAKPGSNASAPVIGSHDIIVIVSNNNPKSQSENWRLKPTEPNCVKKIGTGNADPLET